MKTYYFEDHIKISDRKPVEGYVEAYNGENKIFEGHNLVVDAGRLLIKGYMMDHLYLFYGNGDNGTTPISEEYPKDNTCKIPTSEETGTKENNISITRKDDGLVTTLDITITPTMGSSNSIQELGTFFKITDGDVDGTLFSRITFPIIPLTTDPITFIYKLYF